MLHRREFGGQLRAKEGATKLAEAWVLLSDEWRTHRSSWLANAISGLQMEGGQTWLLAIVLFERKENGGGDGWQRWWQRAL